MKRARLLLLAAAGLTFLGPGPSASAKAVRFQRLPEAKLAAVPAQAQRPKTVRGSSRVEGIHLSRGPKEFRRGNTTPQAYLLSSKAAARRFDKDGFSGDTRSQNSCFTVVPNGFDGHRFPQDQSAFASVWAESKTKRRVSMVRNEAFVRGAGDTGVLKTTDAYVDAVSLGAKLIGTRTLTLQRVGSGPQGVDVYAARDGHKVRFVVTSARPDAVPGADPDHLQGIQLASGSEGGFSNCPFLSTTMDADTRGGGVAATAFVRVPVALEESEMPVPAFMRNRGEEVETMPVKELSTRLTAVRLSVSRTSSDRVPVVSVTFGWEGDVERRRI